MKLNHYPVKPPRLVRATYSPLRRRVAWLAFAGALACGPLPAAPAKGKVVMDVDLTKDTAGPAAKVEGGKWERGWRVTGNKQRIVWDVGRPIAAGVLEISFTAKNRPPNGEKTNYAGMHEHAHLNQNEVTGVGDIFYARTGGTSYFSRVKAFVKKWDHTEFDKTLGKFDEWIADDTALMTIRFEWGGGKARFTSPGGVVLDVPPDKVGISSEHKLDALRYIFVGSDRYNGFAPIGVRFTRVKLTEQAPSSYRRHPAGTSASETWPRMPAGNRSRPPLQK